MASKQKQTSDPKRPTTQRYLDIQEIRDDIVALKDGTVRAVILVSSINFALKSTDEQQAVIQAYMQFLNGLDYPLQVVIQSRKMRIDDYVARMREASADLKNELLRTQTDDYISFIQELVAGNDIMSKRFYIIVPYDPFTNKKRNFWTRAGEALAPGSRIRLSEKQFVERQHELEQRVAQALGSLNSMGLSGARLDTQSLIEMYYNSYNPVTSQAQPLADVSKLDIDTSYGF
ncbi:hypothetical protein COV06_04370 [Candidatus Uhrbacteria bacterium CG10_big_fil_rev_8_21_14_0_10_50_16]|uniref:TraC-like domain-containing protein n=1 Tax=Candidatus Uhrbacteria bacterium CG10_big_fil_rev_8_21_14_0_10_50_16 TaxID=1975039 RepID=A0A2H0RLE8_9BACT|nr:MAG: hypothetical protein COV06_04370 [Candidatus Uhrbacteria bacterium CG10_big_fil_rev_8_21_14_0_10_50_16]